MDAKIFRKSPVSPDLLLKCFWRFPCACDRMSAQREGGVFRMMGVAWIVADALESIPLPNLGVFRVMTVVWLSLIHI